MISQGNIHTKVGGYISKIGIMRKDGSVEWRDYHSKNTVTKMGVDFIMGLNVHSDAVWPRPRGNFTNYGYFYNCDAQAMVYINHYPSFLFGNRSDVASKFSGALEYCWRGTGSTPSTIDDTSLNEPYGNKTNVKYCYHREIGGNNCCNIDSGSFQATSNQYFSFTHGTYNSSTQTYNVKVRVTHLHEVEATDVTIRELGYFGRGGNPALTDPGQDWRLFSRIVLEHPVELLAGERLISMYDLNFVVDAKIKEGRVYTLTNPYKEEGGVETDDSGIPCQIRPVMYDTGSYTNPMNNFVPNLYQERACATFSGDSWTEERQGAMGRYLLFPCCGRQTAYRNLYDENPQVSNTFFPLFWNTSGKNFPALPSVTGTQGVPNAVPYRISTSGGSNGDNSNWASYNLRLGTYVSGQCYRDVICDCGPYFNGTATYMQNLQDFVAYYMDFRGLCFRFGKIVTDSETGTVTWQPIPLRLKPYEKWTISIRVTWDIGQEEGSGSGEGSGS